MFNKFINWLKIKFRKWLLDEEYFMGVDWGYSNSTIVIVKRNRKTGVVEVIQDTKTLDKTERELEMQISQLAKKYNITKPNVVRDYPPFVR